MLNAYDGETFYGCSLDLARLIPHLRCEIGHEVQEGQPYSYITFSDSESVKWKIMPNLGADGAVLSLRAQQRNRRGGPGFHDQCVREQASEVGVNALIRYIKQYETFEQRSSGS
ncbi:MAG: hypothetical protein BroJett011_15940 [Chloroflexota bacterium]|nr:MAG: hypothetical protein BroJett011_15940 [Chloroflexota bacterium]